MIEVAVSPWVARITWSNTSVLPDAVVSPTLPISLRIDVTGVERWILE